MRVEKIVGSVILCLTSVGTGLLTISAAQQSDDVITLVTEQGWQLVQGTCTRCHSAQIIVQNSGTREVWKSRIAWMQRYQGLEELSPVIEDGILDYLAANYGQKTASRRPGLKPSLLPANPYGK